MMKRYGTFALVAAALFGGCGRSSSNDGSSTTSLQLQLWQRDPASGYSATEAPLNTCVLVGAAFFAQGTTDHTSIQAAPAAVTVSLQVTGPTTAAPARLYSDGQCATATTSISILAQSNGQNFWVKSTTAGQVTITPTATGYAVSPLVLTFR